MQAILSRLRDPLTLAFVAMSIYAVVVGGIGVSRLRDAPGAVAGSIRDGVTAVLPSPSDRTVEFTVTEGAVAQQIADELATEGVIDDAGSFMALLGLTGVAGELQAGRYEFALNTPASEVIRLLREGPPLDVLLTIREGLRVEELVEILESEGIGTREEIEAALALDWSDIVPALDDRPEGADLLGYLFPASYVVTPETTAESFIEQMLRAFEEQVTPEIRAAAEERGLTLHEVLTLASIVDREAVWPDEKPEIAAAFSNRLGAGVSLDADPTVQFALTIVEGGEASIELYGYWKPQIFLDDLDVQSPYNTYRNAGLPPGPIASPGLGAIEAAANPADSEVFYFVAAPECDGTHRFAETFEEHLANVEAFNASGCGDEE
jgi:UPF0755 protein